MSEQLPWNGMAWATTLKPRVGRLFLKLICKTSSLIIADHPDREALGFNIKHPVCNYLDGPLTACLIVVLLRWISGSLGNKSINLDRRDQFSISKLMLGINRVKLSPLPLHISANDCSNVWPNAGTWKPACGKAAHNTNMAWWKLLPKNLKS